ncbi:MAG: hypothetical protein CMB42_04695 [Euryarchaeota archaeon]|nr:hypothetical protein [Euryarchaeota archaeon]|tara:strand:- start:16799 stop:17044 length:246 start_codon:yes stop_codon:yes gene_type:complete
MVTEIRDRDTIGTAYTIVPFMSLVCTSKGRGTKRKMMVHDDGVIPASERKRTKVRPVDIPVTAMYNLARRARENKTVKGVA